MSKKNTRNTRSRIVKAAWDLFYKQGYQSTTVEEIVETSGTSKGSFYHYFSGKDDLLGTLSTLFDEKYQELEPLLDPHMTAMEKLLVLNAELFGMIEESISMELLAQLLSSQLLLRSRQQLLDKSRFYYKLLRKIIEEGQSCGEFETVTNANDKVKLYALCERALLYDWCLCQGEYSLKDYSRKVFPSFLESFRKKS